MGIPPAMTGYKPFGLPGRRMKSVVLLYEEYEAMRLADYENLTQEDAAKEMDISRPTFTRIYDKARKAIAQAFVEGKGILIEGGNIHSQTLWYKCDDCYHVTITENQTTQCEACHSENITPLTTDAISTPNGNMTQGFCICPSCKTKVKHKKGTPCREHKCPECGEAMIRT